MLVRDCPIENLNHFVFAFGNREENATASLVLFKKHLPVLLDK